MKEYIKVSFEYIFNEEPNEVLMTALVEEWGEPQIRKVIRHLLFEKHLDQLRGPKGRNNPYGLIEAICKNDKARIPVTDLN